MTDIITDYFDLREQVFSYFGYEEDWCCFPLADCREYYWKILKSSDDPITGEILYADTEKDLDDEDAGKYYSGEIYTQRHLDQWVYERKSYTLALIDTQCDGNKLLMIFDNSKMRP